MLSAQTTYIAGQNDLKILKVLLLRRVQILRKIKGLPPDFARCGMPLDLVYYGYRYYNASVGRWASRDPLGERQPVRSHDDEEESEDFRQPPKAVGLSHEDGPRFASHQSRWGDSCNLYCFLDGNALGRFDPLGLITFKGCTQAQQDAMKAAFKENCDKVNDTLFSCCMKAASGVYDLRKICERDNLQVICHQEDSFWNHCSGRCGWTHWFRSIDGKPIIHMCRSGLNGYGCPGMGCTMFHEMMHTSNWFHSEIWAQKVEVCLGCPPTDLWPGGPPPLP